MFKHFTLEEIDSGSFQRSKERLFCDVTISENLPSPKRWRTQRIFLTRGETEEASKKMNNFFHKPLTFIESIKEAQIFKAEIKNMKKADFFLMFFVFFEYF
jgi:hypothetical protein